VAYIHLTQLINQSNLASERCCFNKVLKSSQRRLLSSEHTGNYTHRKRRL